MAIDKDGSKESIDKNRRNFVKASAVLGAAAVTTDPFIRALASEIELTPEELAKKIGFDCHFLRESDYANFHFYFVGYRNGRGKPRLPQLDRDNLIPLAAELDCETLEAKTLAEREKTKPALESYERSARFLFRLHGKPAYLIIRLPQQYIGEQSYCLDPEAGDSGYPKGETAASFVSGYSYLTLKFRNPPDRLQIQGDKLLDWSGYDVVSLVELKNEGKIAEPLDLEPLAAYPTAFSEKQAFPSNLNLNDDVPVTALEMPNRMIMAPTRPESVDSALSVGSASMVSESITFANWTGTARDIKHFKGTQTGGSYFLYELWQGFLEYSAVLESSQKSSIQSKNISIYSETKRAVVVQEPEYLVVAFDESDADELEALPGVNVLPDPRQKDRSELARDIWRSAPNISSQSSDPLLLSGLGSSHNLGWDNSEDLLRPTPKVGYTLESKLGRPNEVRIIDSAIECQTGLRVKIARITQRTNYRGLSFLRVRWKIEPLELEKTYLAKQNPASPFKSVRVAFEATYFTPWFEGSKDEAECTTLFKSEYFFLFKENKSTFDDALKLAVVFTDQDGNEHRTHISPFVIISRPLLDQTFSESTIIRAQKFGMKHIEGHRSYYVDFGKAKVAMVPRSKLRTKVLPIDGEPEDRHEERLATNAVELDRLKFYFDYDRKLRYQSSVIQPAVLFLEARLRQIEGLDLESSTRTTVFSPSLISLRRLDTDSYKDPQDAWLKRQPNSVYLNLSKPGVSVFSNGNNFELEDDRIVLQWSKDPIRGLFSANYKKIGAMVNPGVQIDSISDQSESLIFRESSPIYTTDNVDAKYQGYISKAQSSIKFARPADVLRDLNAEIFSGITILDILKELLPLEDLPSFEALDDTLNAVEAIADQVQEVKEKYEEVKGYVKENKAKIKSLEKILTAALKHDLRPILDSYNDKLKQLQEVQARLLEYKLPNGKTLSIAAVRRTLEKKAAEAAKRAIASEYNKLGIPEIEPEKLDANIRELSQAYMHKPLEISRRIDQLYTRVASMEKQAKEYKDYPKQIEYYIQAQLEKELVAVIDANKIEELEYNLQEARRHADKRARAALERHLQRINSTLSLSEAYVLERQVALEIEIKELQDRLGTEGLSDFIRLQEKLYAYLETYQKLYSEFKDTENRLRALEARIGLQIENKEKLIEQTLGDEGQRLKAVLQAQKESALKTLKNHKLYTRYKEIIEEGIALAPQLEDDYESYEIRVKVYRKSLERYILDAWQEQFPEIATVEGELKNFKEKLTKDLLTLENFVSSYLKDIEAKLKAEFSELSEAIEDKRQDVDAIRRRIEYFSNLIKTLKSIDKKEITFNWETKDFKDANFGIVKFTKMDHPATSLTLNNKQTINFDLRDLTKPPILKSIDVETHTSLKNFGISFFSIFDVQFAEARFVAGNQVKDDFDIKIRDVNFGGALKFVQAFQEKLDTMSKGLIFDVDAEGAKLSYLMPLSDIIGGGFNFANAKLMMGMTLPFESGKPLSARFGLNDPKDMFIVTVGVYGGRGCFQIGADVRGGITEILLVLEYGAVVFARIGIAEGIAYIFAGIYMRRTRNTVEIRGYVTAGGIMDIAGLITVSTTFYIGMEGNGESIRGVAIYTFFIKLGPLVEFDVDVRAERQISGSSSDKDSAFRLAGAPLPKDVPPDLGWKNTGATKDEWRAFFGSYY